MKKGPVTPKGFRDIAPELAKKRRGAISTVAKILEEYGFVPLETPTLEFAETLLGKYGEDEKLIYTFSDRGGRNLALRYDLTVPLARYVANNLGILDKEPFRRYQIGQVFRGENPQAGRFREFTQFDFDSVGSSSLEEDARVMAAVVAATRKLGLNKARLAVNDRKNFEGLSLEDIREIDKLYKVGRENIKKELLNFIDKTKKSEDINKIFSILEENYSPKEGEDFFFDPTLARGLDYYTGIVFELKPQGKSEDQTIGGGGRYDRLIGMFAGKEIPAVGFSFGVDRLIEEIS